ncbi:MAG: hypothetical protein GY769_21665 [bacterium]|nr:hypothetical protein [bacterium]
MLSIRGLLVEGWTRRVRRVELGIGELELLGPLPELGKQQLQTSTQQIALGRGDLCGQAPPLAHAAARPGEQPIKVMQQALQRVRWLLLLELALDLQIQLWVLDQALANRRRRVAPGGI